MPGCLFCSAVAGTLAVQTVLDNPTVLAFLDHRPVFKGHLLVVPRSHIVTIADLPADLVGPYFAEVRRMAIAVQTGLDAGGSFVALNNIVSQSVPHLHTHIVPRTKGDGLRGFFWPRTRYEDDAEMEATAAAIRAAIRAAIA